MRIVRTAEDLLATSDFATISSLCPEERRMVITKVQYMVINYPYFKKTSTAQIPSLEEL